MTEVLTDRVTSPALEQIWADYTKPVLLEDDVLGTLVLDREFSVFNGNCQWMGSSIRFSLSVDINKRGTWARAVNVMRQLVSEQVSWDVSLKQMAAKQLTALANDLMILIEVLRRILSLRMSLFTEFSLLSFISLREGDLLLGMKMMTCFGVMLLR